MSVHRFGVEVTSINDVHIWLRTAISTIIKKNVEIGISELHSHKLQGDKLPVLMICGSNLPDGARESSSSNGKYAWKMFPLNNVRSPIDGVIRYIESLIESRHEEWMSTIEDILESENETNPSLAIEFSGYEIRKQDDTEERIIVSIMYTGIY
ncbi:hypothetical protein M0R01_03330 [bacterium]|nr:hypothetical protein [bacterium]